MHNVDLRGSYAQMGRQQGLLLREAGFGLPPPDPRMLRFARQCEELVGRHAPELLEEMQAVGGAAEVDHDALMTLTLTMPKAVLRDHDGLVCSHGAHFPDLKFGTLWSVAGKPGDRSLDLAAGLPCHNRYETVAF